MSESSDSRTAALLAPISPEAPAGRSVRYDPEYETLKGEADKIGGLAAATVDWSRLAGLAAEILEKKSKDLLVMSYFCLAQFQTGGYDALGPSLGGMRGLLDRYWDHLFPEANRVRARVAAIEWLVERCAAAVQGREASPSEQGGVEASLAAVDALDAWLKDKLLHEAPSLGDLRGALNERLSAVAPAETTAPSATVPVGEVARAPAAAPAGARDLGDPESREEALKEALTALKVLSSAMWRADPRDAVAYRLARVATWGRLRVTPPDTDGKTSVPARRASTEILDRWSALAARGEWSGLLEQSESEALDSILWLDPHRFSAQALKGLGKDFDKAERVVVQETSAFLRAFPRIAELSFSNGMPFASAETREWIEQEVLAAAVPARNVAAQVSSAGIAPDDAVEKASELARAGKIGEAVALLVEGGERPASARERFLRRMALARILAEARELRAAVAQMERLEADLSRFGVEEWEPALAVEALSVHLRLQRALAKSEGKGAVEVARKAEDLYARLARLDARAAMAMKS